jgi:hypothetical protein
MPKTIKILADAPKEPCRYAIVPFGLYMNAALLKAKPYDIIRFLNGWRKDDKVLVRTCRISVNTSAFDFMLKSIYGERTRWEDIRNSWEMKAVIEGYGRKAFSPDECLMIEVKEYDKTQYLEELKMLKARNERIAREHKTKI